MTVTVADAKARRVVSWGDGRTGRLVRVPAQSSRVSVGGKARVLLQSGAHLSVDPELLEVVE